ncbi:hypothetical protein FRC08_009668, partial [Ceratobasidium sp. 394]
MHTSCKRQMMPPVTSSPLKHSHVALPEPSHPPLPNIQSRDMSPNPPDNKANASGWSMMISASLFSLLHLLADGSVPSAVVNDTYMQALGQAREALRDAASMLRNSPIGLVEGS